MTCLLSFLRSFFLFFFFSLFFIYFFFISSAPVYAEIKCFLIIILCEHIIECIQSPYAYTRLTATNLNNISICILVLNCIHIPFIGYLIGLWFTIYYYGSMLLAAYSHYCPRLHNANLCYQLKVYTMRLKDGQTGRNDGHIIQPDKQIDRRYDDTTI